jgi:hypothetical protein
VVNVRAHILASCCWKVFILLFFPHKRRTVA